MKLIVSLLAASLFAHSALAADGPVEVDRIVAVVNSEVITRSDLRLRVDQVTRQLSRQGTTLPPAEVLEKQVLERQIIERLQLQLATETSLRVDDVTLDRALGRIADNNKLSMTDFRKALEKDGLSWERFREEVRNEILLTRVREREVEGRIVVSDAEVSNFLANPENVVGKEEYNLSHILFRTPEGASPEQLARVRAKAEGVAARITRGEAFDKLAASYSDAPDALSGGNLGWRSAERLPGIFAEAVAGLKPGETTPILRSAAGFHIVRVVDSKGGSQAAAPVQVQQTRARHILIKTSEVVSDADARRRLTDLRERVVQGGANFADLAKVHSADLSASKGGDLGWIYPGDTVPEFEQAMEALKPGELSQPVQSPFGWHLIVVEERRVQDVSDDRKRAAARNALRDRKADEAYQDWLRQLRDRAYVEYRLEEK
ncbi:MULTISPECIES: peptidylprolyl isomerase [Zoogloea]|jgi:peptidyl-prolyl cis-trans isomerase SurA|uniref:Chaperone SurA n=1 Tax=Zoogloea oleivorans TaxID=1552750 RepID=A0A6C2CPF0_9RHOO|nr:MULTISPECIES: peptidylprolyl isomerase [Zoogloea]MDD2667180.1 peptidylprolyl isomerase [Zoogloea sp.]MDY0035754.1 peptidylprolyl isomerase [Zoogloea oleivorans]TYC55897.1 molecular chaperone SurA [Zoogloea oleivorans]